MKSINQILQFLLRSLARGIVAHSGLQESVDKNKVMLAKHLTRSLPNQYDRIEAIEYSCFSQFGDDGILQYLIHKAQVASRSFIEIGTGDYRESNTRLLLMKDNWSGVIVDGSHRAIASVRRDPVAWQHGLRMHHLFLTSDNIDRFTNASCPDGAVGLLSIDVDGVDYYLWRAISTIRPTIVVIEYNALFGSTAPVTVPYDPAFKRFNYHYSGAYFGSSLAALASLGHQKGYSLVACNSAGNNAYFVRQDSLGTLPAQTLEQAFRPRRFNETRSPSGELNFATSEETLRLIAELPLLNVVDGQTRSLANSLNIAIE